MPFESDILIRSLAPDRDVRNAIVPLEQHGAPLCDAARHIDCRQRASQCAFVLAFEMKWLGD